MNKASRLTKSISTAALTLSLFAAGSAPALADTRFDGAWIVRAVAENGDCVDRTIPLLVQRGQISLVAFGVNAKGQVASDGGLTVSVSRRDETVTASGLLDDDSGAGTWESPAKSCAGHWTASKNS